MALLAASSGPATAAVLAAEPGPGDPEPGPHGQVTGVLVGLDAVPPGLATGEGWLGGTVAKVNPVLRYVKLAGITMDAAEAALAGRAGVRYVAPDTYAIRILATPDDPRWADQYGPAQVNAPAAWDTTTGEATRNVCIVDTGVRHTHEDLAGARWLGGVDLVNDDNDPMDDEGHGTHVAGTAAAGLDNGVGIAGLGNVGILGVKVLNDLGGGQVSDIADGIQWCADNGGHVVNLSLHTEDNPAMQDAVAHAVEAGVLVVAAAGNDGQCTDCVNFPASHPDVVAVTCTTDTEAQCNFSSEGPEAEVAAPGNDILSTCFNNDADYCTKSGTSMSTPHVVGVAALLWSLWPALTADELRGMLRDTARDVGPAGWDEEFGHGIVDAHAALLAGPSGGAPGNQRPDAHAGYDHTWWDDDLDGAAQVTLDGTRSADPDGSLVDHEWIDLATGAVVASGPTVDLTLPLGRHTFRLTVTDDAGGEDIANVEARVLQPDGGPDFEDGFEDGLAAWGVGNSAGPGAWALSEARSVSPTHSLAFTAYGGGEDDAASSPVVSLRGAAGATLRVQSWMEGEQGGQELGCLLGCFLSDFGEVQVSSDAGATWDTLLGGYASSDGDWEALEFDLDSYSGSDVQVRFRFQSDANNPQEGWFLDDVALVTEAPEPEPPVVATVKDQRVPDAGQDGSEEVTLDAYDAHDPDGTIVAWEWRDAGSGAVVATTHPHTLTLPVGKHVFTLRATDDDGQATEDEVVVRVVDPAGGPGFLEGFEDGSAGWSASDGGGPGAWARSDQRAASGAWSMAFTGYGADEDDALLSPPIDLVSAVEATLRLQSWMQGEELCLLTCTVHDAGTIEVTADGGASWRTLLTGYWDSGGAWEALEFDLGPETGEVAQLRFTFTSNGQTHNEGWFLDDVQVDTGNGGAPLPGMPVARAGPDQHVPDADLDGGEPVALDGSASTAAAGQVLVGHEWLDGAALLANGAVATVTLPVGTHTLTLRVTDDLGQQATDTVVVEVVQAAFRDDFEGGAPGWQVQDDGGPTSWALSTTHAASPVHSFAMEDYAGMEDDALLSPRIDLSAAAQATLRFASRAEGFEQCVAVCSVTDYGKVEVSGDGGATWRVLLDEHWDTSQAFEELSFDLGPEAGSADVQLRFTWVSGMLGGLGQGWWVDDVEVEVA